MTSFGIMISQEGTPVDKAADTQKVLDSRWEYMNISIENTITMSRFLSVAGVTVVPLLRHNLGFLPAFSIQVNNPIGFDNSDISIRFVADTYYTYMLVNFSAGVSPTATISGDIEVRIFNCDITRPYKAPIQKASPNLGVVDSIYGAKVVDENAGNIHSSAIEDYTLNTQAKAICIQEHGTVIPSGGVITITHNFGTPPSFAVAKVFPIGVTYPTYGSPLGSKPLISTINSTEGIGTVNKQTLVLRGAQYALQDSERFAYILYKDPLETKL